MRNLLMALVVVALVAAPAMASVSVRLVWDGGDIWIGQTATVSIQMQGSTKSPGQLGGDIHAFSVDGGRVVSSNFAWVPQFTAPYSPLSGAALSDGGWGGFGSMQPIPNDRTVGLAPNWWTVATFTVTGAQMGYVTLAITPAYTGGFGPCKSIANPTIDSTIGTLTPVVISVGIPEPVSLVLLAVGGLFAARRRRWRM